MYCCHGIIEKLDENKSFIFLFLQHASHDSESSRKPLHGNESATTLCIKTSLPVNFNSMSRPSLKEQQEATTQSGRKSKRLKL